MLIKTGGYKNYNTIIYIFTLTPIPNRGSMGGSGAGWPPAHPCLTCAPCCMATIFTGAYDKVNHIIITHSKPPMVGQHRFPIL